MKKVLVFVLFLGMVLATSFADTSGNIVVTGTIASNLSLTINSTAYAMVSAGVSAATPATISALSVKSNAKTSFTLAVSTSNVANSSFNAKTTLGTGTGGVELWPYKLYLEDVKGGTETELTPTASSKTFTRKTAAIGDAFNLKTSYASAESLNLDAGTYSDTIIVTLTAN